jgi:hypothetical protein
MEYIGDVSTKETERFVRFLVDMLNTRSMEESIYKRKPDLAPYRTSEDTRLEVKKILYAVCMHGLISNCIVARMGMDEWDTSVQKRQKYTTAQKANLKKGVRKNYTAAERHRMCLSQETLEGLRISSILCNFTQ